MDKKTERTQEMAFLALKAQRCFILGLQNLRPNPMQLRNLNEIFQMNVKLALILGLEMPTMEEIAKESMEIADLERLLSLNTEKL